MHVPECTQSDPCSEEASICRGNNGDTDSAWVCECRAGGFQCRSSSEGMGNSGRFQPVPPSATTPMDKRGEGGNAMQWPSFRAELGLL